MSQSVLRAKSHSINPSSYPSELLHQLLIGPPGYTDWLLSHLTQSPKASTSIPFSSKLSPSSRKQVLHISKFSTSSCISLFTSTVSSPLGLSHRAATATHFPFDSNPILNKSPAC